MPAPPINDFDLDFVGMDSATEIEKLQRGFYRRSMNTLRRGAIVQCRPGYEWKFNCPAGNLQGLVKFMPMDGSEQLIFAVEGKVYKSLPPFTEYQQIPNIQFDPYAPNIYWATCEQAVRMNIDGSLTLIDPRAILMMQDGVSAPAYYDGGADSGHVTNGDVPQGTVMCWSGGRLWVARDRVLFASDYANPLSFVEANYIGSLGSFILPGRITALSESASVAYPVLLAFTETTTTSFQSNNRNRLSWSTTPDFQKIVLPSIGCVSHRSIVSHNGMLWWYSTSGIMRLDIALSTQGTSAVPILDRAMGFSKARLSPDRSVICGSAFEDYLLMSVPYCDLYNRHTWVLGLGGESGKMVWESYWTGTRPVEWATLSQDGRARIFYASKDYDGVNRLWEAFSTQRRDNGCSIVWTLETRAYNGSTRSMKRWRYADVRMTEMDGDVDVLVYWGPARRGRYKRVSSKRVRAFRGTIRAARHLVFDQDEFALKKQGRNLATEEEYAREEDDMSSCGVESDDIEQIDTAFQLCLMVSGPGAVYEIDAYMDPQDDDSVGTCEDDETELNAVRFDGASEEDDYENDLYISLRKDQIPEYTGNATATASYYNITTTGSYTATTKISQEAADKMAQEGAQMRAAKKLEATAPPFLGGLFGL